MAHPTAKSSAPSNQLRVDTDAHRSRAPHTKPLAQTGQDASLESTSTGRSYARLCIPACMLAQSPDIRDLLLNAPEHLSCTANTLRELDLRSIQHNLNLRIDLCYDHDLFFQPISGKKGSTKRVDTEKCCLALAVEFQIYFHNAQTGSCAGCAVTSTPPKIEFAPRLPALFENLKSIVEMLVPVVQHEEIACHFEVDRLMQEVQRGIFDLPRLADWLAVLLTSHCAPMRDVEANAFREQIHQGAANGDMQTVVAGIEKLFALLEAMKLDVANHQIRELRYQLIEETVPFQQDYFARLIEKGKFDTSRSKSWFRRAQAEYADSCRHQPQHTRLAEYRAFIHGLVNLCDPTIKRVPNTLQYDYQRLMRLQEDLQDLVHLELCRRVFEQRIAEVDRRISRARVEAAYESLKSRIISLTEDDDGNGGAISDHLDAVSTEITRAVLALRRPAAHGIIDMSSAHIADIEFERTNKTLYECFEAEEDDGLVTRSVLAALESHTVPHALKFLSLSTLEVSNRQRQWAQMRSKANQGNDYLLADMEDMSRRIAQIGAVHWRVWAESCYLKDDDTSVLSPVSVHGDVSFYGDDLHDLYSPSIACYSPLDVLLDTSLDALLDSPVESPPMALLPATHAGFEPAVVANQAVAFTRKEATVFHDSGFGDFTDDSPIVSGHAIDADLDMDMGTGTSTQLHKGSARRNSM